MSLPASLSDRNTLSNDDKSVDKDSAFLAENVLLLATGILFSFNATWPH